MAKSVNKAKKVGLLDLIKMVAAAVGLVLAVVGLCVPFFAQVTTSIVGDNTQTVGLFGDYEALEALMEGGITIVVIQSIAIISLIFTVFASVLVILGKLGIIRMGAIVKLIFAVVTVVLSVLVMSLAVAYAAQSPLNLDGGSLGSTSFVAAAGAYLMMAGGIVSGVTLVLSKLK